MWLLVTDRLLLFVFLTSRTALAMADIRTLLRNELATRKGSAQTGSAANRVTKKRKVDIGDDSIRKKMKPGMTAQQEASHTIQPPSAQDLEEDAEKETAGPELPSEPKAEQEADGPDEVTQSANVQPAPANYSQTVDEDEWAAFEREVAAPTRALQAPAAVAAPATISAAPMSTEQIAEQQEKEKETTQTREAQTEGEREDAARFMEDEFDEMEQLEERVRRLKQKREELRAKRASEEAEPRRGDEAPPPATESNEQEADAGSANEDEEEDEDDDDAWDDWRFK